MKEPQLRQVYICLHLLCRMVLLIDPPYVQRTYKTDKKKIANMRSTSLSKLSVIICFFVCLFFCCFFCKTNKLRAIWVGRLGTLAKKTLALKVEVEVVLLYVKP